MDPNAYLKLPFNLFFLVALMTLLWSLQVSQGMLAEALIELFSDAEVLEAHRMAAKQAYYTLSCGVVQNIWSLVQSHILDRSVTTEV